MNTSDVSDHSISCIVATLIFRRTADIHLYALLASNFLNSKIFLKHFGHEMEDSYRNRTLKIMFQNIHYI